MSKQGTSKILHILYSGQGGLGTYFMNFVRSDYEKRFQHFAFFYGIEPLAKEYEEFCKSQNVNFLYVSRSRKLDFAAFGSCRQFIKNHEIRYALLHTFSMTPFYLSLRKTAKVISIDHTAYQVKTRLEWVFAALNHLLAFKAIYFYQLQFKVIKRKFPFLRAGSNSHYIPKTVDIKLFVPTENPPIEGRSFVIGTTGRIVKGKRHDLLIESINRLKKSGSEVYLRVAGNGSDLAYYKSMVDEKGLNDYVEFMGRLEANEMITFYQSLDAYIHASNGETICYSIMEAQACGLPILASNVDGINNVITHKRDGLLFENQTNSICESILELQSNKQFYADQKIRSRALAESNSKDYNPVEIIASILC